MSNSSSINLTFLNTYAEQLADMGSFITPTKLPNPKWLATSDDVAELLGLTQSELNSDDFLLGLSGHQPFEHSRPLAQKYTGHQFGQYNPELGDGRGILLGELQTEHGRWDVHVKGAGQTPYSRFGDGRAVVRSCIREFLGSEALFYLGIDTSRALGVFTTSEQVKRETLEQGAALIRICQSHIRFGHFEYAFYQNDTKLLERLIQYTYEFVLPAPQLETSLTVKEKALVVFEHAIKTTAITVAKWQAFGFCHGVMNTDNMSILGLTFDYGPFGFLDEYNPRHICNHSDYSGRYAFDEQPGVALWNLNALGHALSPLLDNDELKQALSKYEPQLLNEYSNLMRNKLGLISSQQQDRQLLGELLALMQSDKRDYTITWRLLSNYQLTKPNSSFTDHFINRNAADTWLEKYKVRLQAENSDCQLRNEQMKTVNPKYILRNYLAQQAIEQAEKGDNSLVQELFEVLKQPFSEQPQFEHYAKTPPDWSKDIEISCSS